MRIAIIGGSGAGKTTLACQIGKALGLPVQHIDQLYWQRAWVVRDEASFMAMAGEALSKESWVFDGFPAKFWNTHAHTLDMIIFIDEPYLKRLWRVFARIGRRQKMGNADISGQLSEIFRKKFIYNWLFGWHLKAHQRCLATLESTPDNVVRVHLKGTKASSAFVENLRKKAGQSPLGFALTQPLFSELFLHRAGGKTQDRI